ncbi:MAG TPA: hypothetical protein VD866_22670 [Urbifossiella sp.]|nr:hypothetical protein [Urbifossiella sp.]
MAPGLYPEFDTPQAQIDLYVLDRNATARRALGRERGVDVRLHFKSLKSGGLAMYLKGAGFDTFLCAILCEADDTAGPGREGRRGEADPGHALLHRLGQDEADRGNGATDQQAEAGV